MTGEVTVKVTTTGQQISLLAMHRNRTVKFTTDYDVLDQRFKQHSRLELAPTAWLEYDVELVNKTVVINKSSRAGRDRSRYLIKNVNLQDESSEAQEVEINLSYPRRNFTAIGSYNISYSSMSSDVSLIWDKERKTLEAGLDWRRDESHPSKQELQVQISHPSFEKVSSSDGLYYCRGGP